MFMLKVTAKVALHTDLKKIELFQDQYSLYSLLLLYYYTFSVISDQPDHVIVKPWSYLTLEHLLEMV